MPASYTITCGSRQGVGILCYNKMPEVNTDTDYGGICEGTASRSSPSAQLARQCHSSGSCKMTKDREDHFQGFS